MKECSLDEIKELPSFVRLGCLFGVQKWIDSGKSIRTALKTRINPLRFSVETGFQSMVEIFLHCHLLQNELDEMLWEAVQTHREDLVRMILERGGSVRSMPFVDVLNEWHPGIVKLFLKHGADFKSNAPFAEAFAGRRRTVLGVFKSLLETDPTIIDQANQALIYHVIKGNEKWVLLMLWLGADSRAPTINMEYPHYLRTRPPRSVRLSVMGASKS